MSLSAANASRDLRIYVKDRGGWPLTGADVTFSVDGSPVGTVRSGNGQAQFTITGPPTVVDVTASYQGLTQSARLGPTATTHTLKFPEVRTRGGMMDFLNDKIALIAGAVLWAVAVILAFRFDDPNALQEQIIRGTFALGAGGIASVIPGLLNVQIGSGKRLAISAAGALAVYLLSYVVVPGQGIGNII